MGFDRSQFGTTSLSTLREQEVVQKELTPSLGKGRSNKKIVYHKYDIGKNIFRIYPFHLDGEGKSFFEPKTQSFLSIEVQKYGEDNKPIKDEFEIKRKPVFGARTHGVDKNDNPLKYDLVDTYLETLQKLLKEQYEGDDSGYSEKWKIATNYKSKDSIKPSYEGEIYADKRIKGEWVFGIMPVKVSIKKGLNELAASVEDTESVVNPDPYSNADTGICINVKYDPSADMLSKYKVSFEETQVKKEGGGFTIESNPTPIDDKRLQNFLEVPSLHEKLRRKYTESTFKKQIEGLMYFDSVYKFGICDTDEFLEALTYLRKNVLLDPEEERKEEKPTPATAEKAVPKTVKEKEEKVPFDSDEVTSTTTVEEVEDNSTSDRLKKIMESIGK